MKATDIENPGLDLFPQDISRFEEELRIKLPVDYRNFLLVANGGCPPPNLFTLEDALEVEVRRFFSMGDNNSQSLQREIQILKDDLPYGVIPIAIDWGGNRICLGIDAPFLNEVFFWNHEKFGNEALTKIAESFSSFLDNQVLD